MINEKLHHVLSSLYPNNNFSTDNTREETYRSADSFEDVQRGFIRYGQSGDVLVWAVHVPDDTVDVEQYVFNRAYLQCLTKIEGQRSGWTGGQSSNAEKLNRIML